jgi:hypothetical protein
MPLRSCPLERKIWEDIVSSFLESILLRRGTPILDLHTAT